MKLLLDTCAFLWLALPQEKLSGRATALINDSSNELFLSDVSAWEITLKHAVGRLPLPDIPKRWLPTRAAFFKVQWLALTRDAIFRGGELPMTHMDPFDRLLAAQAIEAQMTLLSPDTPISLLGAVREW